MNGRQMPSQPVPAGRHLDEAEFVDLLDDALEGARLEHARACPRCRERAEALADAAAGARAVDVPEPSPLFWDHFSARVHEAVADEPIRRGFFRTAFAMPAVQAGAVAAWAAALLVMVLLRSGVWPFQPDLQVMPSEGTFAVDGLPGAAGDAITDLEADEAWALVRTIAEDLDQDEMDGEGVSAGPGSAEHLALRLTAVEQVELARLLREQLEGRRLPESSS